MSTCMYCANCFFVDNVVRTAFLCKHVRLSRVFYNKLTYLLTKAHELTGSRRKKEERRGFIEPLLLRDAAKIGKLKLVSQKQASVSA